MSDYRPEYIDENEISTVLSEDFVFEGELQTEEPVLIKGKLKGAIKSNSVLYVEESAELEAQIEASRFVLKGKAKGQVTATRKVELLEKAELDGNITTPDLSIQSGCRFCGCCSMPARGSTGGNAHE